VNATSVETAPGREAPVRTQTFADRVFAAVPVVGVALALLTFYGVQAWLRKTPWVFSDELEWTQISRAIEETGHSARRGDPIFFKTLYVYLLAPFWAINNTETAYAAIKYVNVGVMTLASVPTYLLARMLLPKRASLVVAFLAVCIPAMSYVTTIIPEILGYPWYAFASWVIVRALVNRRPLDYVWVAGVSVVALLIRWPQFATVPASFVVALGFLWVAGPKGQAFRRRHSIGEQIGAAVLLIGALILFNRVFLQHISVWQVSTQYWKGRMIDLGLSAGLAFTVGLGVLPVIGGITSLNLVERRREPAYRAFAAYLGAAVFCVVLYTAVKAAYLSTVFSTLTEERNMIYLSPLMLIGTAMVLQARRIDWRLVGAATALVLFLVFQQPMQLFFPYFEAPGFAILTIPNRHWGWDVHDLQWALVGVLIVGLLVLALRRHTAVVGAAAVLCCAWMLTSEISSTRGFTDFGDKLRSALPEHVDWMDRASGGRPVTYLGQVGANQDTNGLHLTEFWNRSLRHVDSMDGLAPGPGPTGTPDIVSTDGRLSRIPPETAFILADQGIDIQSTPVANWGPMRLFPKNGPWRLLDAQQQVFSDGWAPGWSTYTYFKKGQTGTLEVTLSRTAYTGDAKPGHAKVQVSTVGFDPERGGPVQGKVYATKRTLIRNGEQETMRFHVAQTPVRVEIRITPTFRSSASDPRQLGAQVGFRFRPDRSG
jgi:hypothetical protein